MSLKTILLYSLFSCLVQALLPIKSKGNRFILSSPENNPNNNTVFYIKGIDYQPGGSSGYNSQSNTDVLSDPEKCARDAFVFQQLGINTIRIYSLNPNVNHDKCMTILNDAGIYVVLDVNSGGYDKSLNRANPSGSYNDIYMHRVFTFIEAFKNYSNVLGFISGNEVINNQGNYSQIDPPYIRAIQRDIKEYISAHVNRPILVGYSAADNPGLRLASYNYLRCNSHDGKTIDPLLSISASDFFGLNSYQWCSDISDWESSGYSILNSTFNGSTIPLLFSEYGCNTVKPRTFSEVSEGLYSGLNETFSGGLVYEYSEEANGYGLVDIDNNGNIKYKQDLINLQQQFLKIDLATIYEIDVDNSTIYQCSSSEIKHQYPEFGVDNFTIPEQLNGIVSMIKHGVNATNIGHFLTDYAVPTTFKYEIKDVNDSTIAATITYASSNGITYSGTHTRTSHITSTTNSSSSKSKGAGVSMIHINSNLHTLLVVILSLLL